MSHPSEHGVTLTELTMAIALASVVMVGLVSFYMVSQSTWMSGSAQALCQREATATMETLVREARRSARAEVSAVAGDSTVCQLDLYDQGALNARYSMWWNPSDSLLHYTRAGGATGVCEGSIVERFQVRRDNAIVDLVGLRIRGPEGDRVTLATRVAMQNR